MERKERYSDLQIRNQAVISLLDYPPLAIHRFTGKAFQEGIEKHLIDNVSIQIYNPEKTLADCFNFRNQIGMDVVIEAP